MNILLVTRFYPPDTGGGGIAAYAAYLARGLQRAGHTVRVLSQQAIGSDPRQQVEGIDVIRIRPRTLPYRVSRVPALGRYVRFCNDILYARAVRHRLLDLCAEQTPDIVEYADIDAEGLFHPADSAPAVVKLHTPHFVLRQFCAGAEMPYDTATVGWLEKRAILRAQRLSSPSRHLAVRVGAEYGLPVSRIRFVPNLIDTDFFSPGADREETGTIVLYVGRLERLKGVTVFAYAVPSIACQVPAARFVFLGADRRTRQGASQQAELQTYFREHGLADRVEFAGHAAPEVFRDTYRRAAVCILPSLYENCPYTLLEAMSCGKPIVASRAYGMEEMISEGKTGLLFEPGDSEDLAAKTVRLLQDRPLREQLGAAARCQAVCCYGLEAGTEQTLAFYRAITGGDS